MKTLTKSIAIAGLIVSLGVMASTVVMHVKHDQLIEDTYEEDYLTQVDRVFPSRGKIYIRVTTPPSDIAGLSLCKKGGHWLVLRPEGNYETEEEYYTSREVEYLMEIAYGNMFADHTVRVYVNNQFTDEDRMCRATRLMAWNCKLNVDPGCDHDGH